MGVTGENKGLVEGVRNVDQEAEFGDAAEKAEGDSEMAARLPEKAQLETN